MCPFSSYSSPYLFVICRFKVICSDSPSTSIIIFLKDIWFYSYQAQSFQVIKCLIISLRLTQTLYQCTPSVMGIVCTNYTVMSAYLILVTLLSRLFNH